MKLGYKNIGPEQADNVHGRYEKKLIVLHETVSPDYAGWADINSVSQFLDNKDYGIHGITDLEGHIAWAYGFGDAVFWQCGGVNYESIGIEQVSRVMIDYKTNAARRAAWALRDKELKATAKLCAAISNTRGIPLKAATWDHAHGQFAPGILSHYQVSQHFSASQGHTDCWPVHLGGYYPLFEVIYLARGYKAMGYTL